MRRVVLLSSMVLAAGLHLSACAQINSANAAEAAVSGPPEDHAAFDRYIAGRPTPAQFRAHYPDVLLVLPGEMATKELRGDRSRYFAQLDAQGRITGGRFQ